MFASTEQNKEKSWFPRQASIDRNNDLISFILAMPSECSSQILSKSSSVK